MAYEGSVEPTGDLFLQVVKGETWAGDYPSDPTHRQIAEWALPRRGLSEAVNRWRTENFAHFSKGWVKLAVARMAQRVHGMPFIYGSLYLQHAHGDTGIVDDLGLAGLRVVTTAGVTYLAADMAAGANDINLWKFHGFGTGGTAEASGDTALVTELTTQYNPDSTRPTGSQVASTNTYTTAATFTPDSGGTIAVTEHGIFTQAATGGGTLWDRTLFSVVNVNSATGDSILATYVATFPAGS